MLRKEWGRWGFWRRKERKKETKMGRRGRGKPGKKGQKVLLMKGSGVIPPIHDQNWSLLARPLGSPGSESPGALPTH